MRFTSLLMVLAMASTIRPALADTPVAAPLPAPPVAKRVEKIVTLHGEARSDPYFWLRDKPNPEVAAYLEAENAYTAAVMKPTEPLQDALYSEMLSHVKETDLSVPYREGEWLYYFRTEKGKQYRIYCREKFPDGPEQVILDLNELAKGQKFMALGRYAVSDDGNLLAYSTDNTGFRQYTLFIKDLRANALWPERIEKTTGAVGAADNMTLFYAVEDAAKRPYRVYRHRLLEPQSTDVLVYEEKDERFNASIGRTRSRAWLVLSAHSHTTSESRVLEADKPTGEWILIGVRGKGRALQRLHRPDAEPRVARSLRAQPHDVRVPRSGGRQAHRRMDSRRPARAGARVRRRPPRRPLLHPDELGRPELPPRHRARHGTRPGELEGDRSASGRRDARRRRPLREPSRPSREGERTSALHGHESHDERCARRRVPRAGLLGVRRDEPRLLHECLPVRLSVFRHSEFRLRLRHGREDLEASPGAGGPALRSDALQVGAPLGDGIGRHENPDLARVAREDGRREDPHAERRAVSSVAERLRLLWLSVCRHVFLESSPTPRPRRRRRHRAHPRRRRDGQEVA